MQWPSFRTLTLCPVLRLPSDRHHRYREGFRYYDSTGLWPFHLEAAA